VIPALTAWSNVYVWPGLTTTVRTGFLLSVGVQLRCDEPEPQLIPSASPIAASATTAATAATVRRLARRPGIDRIIPRYGAKLATVTGRVLSGRGRGLTPNMAKRDVLVLPQTVAGVGRKRNDFRT
jgi:hypothetical protein